MKTKKKKQPTPKQLKTKLWELCKKACREQYGNVCYTCGRTGLEGSNWHTGHFVPSSTCGASLRYDLRNLRPQCYHCNVNCGGQGAIFYKRMVEREGQEYVDKIFQDKEKTVKADILFYLRLIKEYEDLLS
jgi:5-methylcytosine-specific restriction endonuclease McrA